MPPLTTRGMSGEGMSYTSFEYGAKVVMRHLAKELDQEVTEVDGESSSMRSLSLREINSQITEYYHRPHLAPPVLKLSVSVKNAGDLDGDEVVMLYVMPPPGMGAPQQNLRNYRRVHLRAGESAIVEFDVTSHDLAFAHADGKVRSAAGSWQIRVGSASSIALHVAN